MFSVGQKVVLVDDKWPDSVLQLYVQLPSLNTVYVIRETRVGVEADKLIMDMQRVLTQSLLLCGVFNPCNKIGVEAGFNSTRFRTLEEIQAKNSEVKVEELVCVLDSNSKPYDGPPLKITIKTA